MTELEAVQAALASGHVAIFPTETLWSLSCRADHVDGVHQIFAAKGRPEGVPLAVGFASIEAAKEYVEWTPTAAALASHLPGPLSIVLRRKDDRLAHCAPGFDTLSIRIPDHPIAQAILAAGPMVMTSANQHGAPDPATREEVAAAFPGVAIVGKSVPGTASTVVDATGKLRILRQGQLQL